MNHTPGPWTQLDQEHAISIVSASIVIADVFKPDDNCVSPPMSETLDNARLIAAAPLMKGQLETGIESMREALRQAAAGDYDLVHALLSGVIAGNELAIAKAEGKEA